MSQNVTDIGRTNLIKLDIPTEDLPIALKPYTVPLKYHEFVDHKNQTTGGSRHHIPKHKQLGQSYPSGAQERRMHGHQ